mmetsp:Transcript_101300/g.285634  ORF Transcript_101300/g.285634 Transcript_101300/m.285634 type:complete len:404 (+) Transcript_101300:440-1651(+)
MPSFEVTHSRQYVAHELWRDFAQERPASADVPGEIRAAMLRLAPRPHGLDEGEATGIREPLARGTLEDGPTRVSERVGARPNCQAAQPVHVKEFRERWQIVPRGAYVAKLRKQRLELLHLVTAQVIHEFIVHDVDSPIEIANIEYDGLFSSANVNAIRQKRVAACRLQYLLRCSGTPEVFPLHSCERRQPPRAHPLQGDSEVHVFRRDDDGRNLVGHWTQGEFGRVHHQFQVRWVFQAPRKARDHDWLNTMSLHIGAPKLSPVLVEVYAADRNDTARRHRAKQGGKGRGTYLIPIYEQSNLLSSRMLAPVRFPLALLQLLQLMRRSETMRSDGATTPRLWCSMLLPPWQSTVLLRVPPNAVCTLRTSAHNRGCKCVLVETMDQLPCKRRYAHSEHTSQSNGVW